MAEHRTFNPLVPGSSPGGVTRNARGIVARSDGSQRSYLVRESRHHGFGPADHSRRTGLDRGGAHDDPNRQARLKMRRAVQHRQIDDGRRPWHGSIGRRRFVKRLLGLCGAVAILHEIPPERVNAARRGYPGPNLPACASDCNATGGATIDVLDGPEPGTIRYDISQARGGPGIYLTVHNRTGFELEVEAIPPDSSVIRQSLPPNGAWYLRVERPGLLRFRAWPEGGEPGDYIDLDV